MKGAYTSLWTRRRLRQASLRACRYRDVRRRRPRNISRVLRRDVIVSIGHNVRVLGSYLRVLRSFVEYLFRPEAFETDFPLNMPSEGKAGREQGSELLLAPAELYKTHDQYLEWIDSLPQRDMPEWIGFNYRAEWLLAARQAHSCIINWSTLLLRGKEEALDFHAIFESVVKKSLQSQKTLSGVGDAEMPEETAVATSWLSLLIPAVQTCLDTVPESAPFLHRTEAMVQNPMFRCFERELAVGAKCVFQQ